MSAVAKSIDDLETTAPTVLESESDATKPRSRRNSEADVGRRGSRKFGLFSGNHPSSTIRKGDMVYARFAEDLPPKRARVVELHPSSSTVELSFQNIDIVVKADQIEARYQPGAKIHVREAGCFLERSENPCVVCTVNDDGTYTCLYAHVPASYVTERFRQDGWSWLEVERSVNAITTAWRKMVALDHQMQQKAREPGGTVMDRVARLETGQKATAAKLDALLAHLKVPNPASPPASQT